jgi:hypothetical protein
MKPGLSILIIIVIFLFVSGCFEFEGKEQVVRTYTHNGSSNVMINIYDGFGITPMILESNSSEVKVVESFYLKHSFVEESGKYVRDYVKFTGNSTNLTINIALYSFVSATLTRDNNLSIEIYLPQNTDYTINYAHNRSEIGDL